MSLNICVPFDQARQSTSQMNLYQQTAPFLFYGSIASGIAWRAVYILPDWLSKLFSTRPMAGIPELKRCHQVLVKYMAIPPTSPISSEEIAGSAELYPHMEALCCVLDEQNIPHPDIDHDGLIIVDYGKWSVCLGKLWAVRHDVEQARKVYREDQRSL